MTKSRGGDEKLANLSSPTELQNFVTEIITSQAGGAKMNKKTGGMELSPFIVSILTLGMRVASDPKLSKMFDKHRKLQGGSQNIATEMYETLVNNTVTTGGKAKNVKKQNVTPKTVNKTKKHGGSESESHLLEGGKGKAKNVKSKKGGSQDVDMKMLDKIEKSLIGGKVKRQYKSKKRGGNTDENTTDVTPVSFPLEDIGPLEEVHDVTDMSSVAAEVEDLQPVSTSDILADDSVELPEVPLVEVDQNGGGKSRKTKKSSVKKGGNKQMIDMMVIPELMNSPVKGGAKKTRGKKVNRRNGGSDNYLLD
jgi:hypothetical protein